jgi:glycosyltransferase involved in cell wall biosynthesis
MRLILVNRYYAHMGGTERYFSEVAPLLEARGVRIAIVYGDAPTGALSFQDREEVAAPELFLGRQSAAERIRCWHEILQRLNPDVIQLHHLEDPILVAACAAKRPTIQFIHVHSPFLCPGDGRFAKTTQEACRRPVGSFCLIAPYRQACGSRQPIRLLGNYRLTKEYLRAASGLRRLIVASRYMRDLVRSHGIPGDRILVNPHPFVSREDPGEPVCEKARSIVFVGRLVEQKGAAHLIRAVARIRERCFLTLVGNGPARGELEGLSTDLLAGRHEVNFAGWLSHEDTLQLMRRHQVVAVPSVWPEPFGRVGVEAMGLGKPVVAFDVGGISEWLVDGRNGYLVPPRDVAALAGALERLLDDAPLRQRMGRDGVELARTRFDPKRHVEVMLALYQEILATPG